MREKLKENKGITLISIIITVIILLLLAGVTTSLVIGENGLIAKSKQSGKKAEISSEKEAIQIAVTQAIEEENSITNLKKYLDYNVGDDKVDITSNGDIIVARFKRSNRYYKIYKNGEVSNPIEMINDKYAGDITKNGKNNGSIEKPFEINCIEDLVAFSIISNGGNQELKLGKNDFSEKYIVLTRNLDFESIFSYNDYTTTKYGDLNKDGIVENIKIELTKKEDKCIGFTPINEFGGIFDGRKNEIQNLYENKKDVAGVFNSAKDGSIIKNLGLTGKIISTSDIGAIAGNNNHATIENCYNKAEIYGDVNHTSIGGIVGWANYGTIKKCYNSGIIISNYKSWGGGIVGCDNKGTIINCYNTANIDVGGMAGGITSRGSGKIINCYNTGNISTTNKIGYGYTSIGGIIGISNGLSEIYNCFNIGELKQEKACFYSGILGYNNSTDVKIYNCLTTKGDMNNGVDKSKEGEKNCFYKDSTGIWKEKNLENENITLESIIKRLNEYIDENKESPEINTKEWKKWKNYNDEYLVFE